jgi:diaminohydroxyphosphoribosylaminopyrimidine deaminase/5-amino-6-(5-phosphoribosylamino)uracil reductase
LKNTNSHTTIKDDEFWMQRCLDLATRGLGNVAPNPLVGCVITVNNKVIGEGYHRKFGSQHAEVVAINSVKDKKLLTNATLYVNLEPCNHLGKTPPCANLIIKLGIKKVVIGALDTNEVVNGTGDEQLRKAGIQVTVNVLKSKCIALNKRFYTYHEKKRPFYILKWAESSDGFIYKKDHDQSISNELSNQKVHQMRAEEQAILIGKNTLLTDNPSLNVRLVSGNNPLRVIVMTTLSDDIKRQKVFSDDIPTIIFNTAFSKTAGHVEYIQYEEGELIKALNKELYQRGISSVLVEGGAITLNSFLSAKNWDEAHSIVSQKIFGKGVMAPKIASSPTSVSKIGQKGNQDVWHEFQNKTN